MLFIRTAKLEDIPVIQQVLASSWHEAYDPIMGQETVSEEITSHFSDDQLIAKLDIPKTEFLVGGMGNEVGGMIFAAEEDECVAICELYVHPKFQRNKIGTNLLKEIENLFYYAENMVLEVLEKNTSAIKFYEKHGFSKMGVSQERHDIEQGLFSTLMNKTIS